MFKAMVALIRVTGPALAMPPPVPAELKAIVVLVSVKLPVDSWARAPPEAAVLLTRDEFESASVPMLSMPPPDPVAVFDVNVLSVIVRLPVAKLATAAPVVALLLVNVSAESTSWFMLTIAPPEPVAALFAKLESETVRLPVASLATPPPKLAALPVMARLDRRERARIVDGAAAAGGEPAGDRQAGDRGRHSGGHRENAGGVVSADRERACARALDRLGDLVLPVLASVSVPPVSVMFCVVLKNTVLGAGLTMLAGLALVLMFAQPTPVLSVPAVSASALVETT